MKPQIIYGEWIRVETNVGTEDLEGDLFKGVPNEEDVRDYLEGDEIYSIERITGYGARLSMPGYLDCTPWCVHTLEQDAKDYLTEMYGDGEGGE